MTRFANCWTMDEFGRSEAGPTPCTRLKWQPTGRGWDNWLRRVDGLQNALRNVTDAAIARFALPPDETSFARTLSFRARRSDIARLQDLYEQLFALVVEIDQHADDKDADDIVSLTLSMFWAPYDLADRADLTEDS